MSCTICIEDTKEPISVTRCNHEYHQSCFDKWEQQCVSNHAAVTCCTCRAVVSDRLTIKLIVEEELIQLRRSNSQMETRLKELREQIQNDRSQLNLYNRLFPEIKGELGKANEKNKKQLAEITELKKQVYHQTIDYKQSLRDKDDVIKGQLDEILELHNNIRELKKIIDQTNYVNRYDFPNEVDST